MHSVGALWVNADSRANTPRTDLPRSAHADDIDAATLGDSGYPDVRIIPRDGWSRVPDNLRRGVGDPTSWTALWTVLVLMTKTDQALHEYACHEANYALEGIMKGARVLEAEFRGEEPEGVANPTR